MSDKAEHPSTFRDINQEHTQQLEDATRAEIPQGQVLRCIDNIPVTVHTLRAVLSTEEISDEAVNGYMRLMDTCG